jgi:hypothetical protein
MRYLYLALAVVLLGVMWIFARTKPRAPRETIVPIDSISITRGAARSPSEDVDAAANHGGNALEKPSTGVLSGRVLDWTSGLPCRATIYFESDHSLRDDTVSIAEAVTRDDGVFQIEGLKPGVYGLLVSTEDARVGSLRGMSVVAGQESRYNTVHVSKGARLSVRYEGRWSGAQIRISCQGGTFPPQWVTSTEPGSRSVSAGEVLVEYAIRQMKPPRATFNTRSEPIALDLTAGETREVVLHDEE